MKYDRRQCYSVKKLHIIQFYLIFKDQMTLYIMSQKLDISYLTMKTIVYQFERDDNFVIVESKFCL